MTRVLIAGGYGVVGSWIARHLRAAGHDLELVLGGRTPAAGAKTAGEVGATVAALDTSVAGAGLEAAGRFDLVISAVQDPDDNLMMAALRGGAAYLGIVRKCDNVGPTAIAAAILAQRAVLIMGHWQAGVMTAAALEAAQAFARVDRVELAALFDYADPAGPMTSDDSGAFFTKALLRRHGAWERVDQAEHVREVSRGDPPPFKAQPMGVLDVAGLEAATSAQDVRFDIGIGPSIGTIAGGSASHDLYIDLWGEGLDGDALELRRLVSDPLGQAHLTALGALIGAERLLGLDGAPPPASGLHFPERLVDPHRALEQLRAFGVRIEDRSSRSARHD